MNFFRRDVGRAGEQAAARFLKSAGYKIIERNYKCPLGEIDIIARDREVVVFVEVKTLSTDSEADPEVHVNTPKMRQIEKTARAWLSSKREPDIACRFDVVSVVMPQSGEPKIRHFIEAFLPTRWCK